MRKWAGAALGSVFSAILCLVGGHPALADEPKWTGAYAGGHIGWVSGATREVLSTPGDVPSVNILGPGQVDETRTFQMSDFIGGVHAGYNLVQRGPYVFGVEGDFDWTRTRDGTASSSGISIGPETNCDGTRCVTTTLSIGSNDSFIRQLDWLSSARARAGYTENGFMLYLTGGIAFASAKAKITSGFHANFDQTCAGDCVDFPPVHILNSSSATTSDRNMLVGYVIGGGAELKITESLVGRVEFLHYDFGSETFSFKFEDGDPFTHKFDIRENVIRVGLSYYLN